MTGLKLSMVTKPANSKSTCTAFFTEDKSAPITYYYRLDNQSTATEVIQLGLDVKLSGHVLIQVEELYRYTDTTLSNITTRDSERTKQENKTAQTDDSFESVVLKCLSDYDKNREFNYLHDVDKTKLIKLSSPKNKTNLLSLIMR